MRSIAMSAIATTIQHWRDGYALQAKAQEILGLVDQMSQAAEYTPSPEAAAEMNEALALLLREYDRQGYQRDEQAEWTCRGLVIAGEPKGDWRVTLQRVDPE